MEVVLDTSPQRPGKKTRYVSQGCHLLFVRRWVRGPGRWRWKKNKSLKTAETPGSTNFRGELKPSWVFFVVVCVESWFDWLMNHESIGGWWEMFKLLWETEGSWSMKRSYSWLLMEQNQKRRILIVKHSKTIAVLFVRFLFLGCVSGVLYFLQW